MSKVTLSPSLKKLKRGKKATYKWGNRKVDYAQKIYAQRPWIETTLEKFDIKDEFLEAIATRNNEAGFVYLAGKLGNEMTATINDYDYRLKSRGKKRFRPGRTYGKITDSGALAASLKIRIR